MTISPEPKPCSVKHTIPMRQKPISVNGKVVSRAAIAGEMQHHPAGKPIDAWFAAASALVIRELLVQEAQRLNLVASPLADSSGRRETEEEALIRGLLEREVMTPQADLDACQRYYDQNQKRFMTPDLFFVSHILLPITDQSDNEESARSKAHAILTILRDDPDAFARLAREYSSCPSREVGGNLGQIGPGQTVPEFENALSCLPIGAIAPEPVRTRYGLHVVRVDQRISGRQIPFEMVQEKISTFLNDRVRQVAERQYIGLLIGQARIEGIQLQESNSPLMQ